MHMFKVGDRVVRKKEYLDNNPDRHDWSKTYTVKELRRFGQNLIMTFEEVRAGYTFYQERFELAEKKKLKVI